MESLMKQFEHLKIQWEDITSATNNFDHNNFVGGGGFGKVYKGALARFKDRSMVAFKRLDRKHGQGDAEFLKEITFLSRYTHENLISLLGFCIQQKEMILVYEYASHGSLDCHLRSSDLTWTQRLKICLSAAKGLNHLHDPRETSQRLIHCDVKSANILLDDKWNAKVADFGLSKVGPANQHNSILVTKAIGTVGYCDPLFMLTYSLTKESDVYSFGVVLFEVLCGRLCYQISNNGQLEVLVTMWKKRYEENKLHEIIFTDLMQNMDPTSLKIFSEIAFQCLKRSREERPLMSHVVEKLEAALKYQEELLKLQDLKGEDIVNDVVPPLIYTSEEEPKLLLSQGFLVNNDRTVENPVLDETQSISPDSDTYWEQKVPNDYKDIIKLSKDSLQWTTKKDLYLILSKGFLRNNAEEWFSLDKNGKKCLMLSPRAACITSYLNWQPLPDSRFEETMKLRSSDVRVVRKINAQLLSSQTTYATYLVYKLPKDQFKFEAPVKVMDGEDLGSDDWEKADSWYVNLVSPQTSVIGRGTVDQNANNPLSRPNVKGIPQQRSDGWMEVQIWEFQTTTTTKKVPMRLQLESTNTLRGLIIQCIELRPV